MKRIQVRALLFFAILMLLFVTRTHAQPARLTSLSTDGINIYAGTERDGVIIIKDKGRSWIPLSRPAEKKNGWWEIDHLGGKGGTIIAGGKATIYISTDTGTSWRLLPPMGELLTVNFNGTDIWMTTHASVFVSNDNGVNWKDIGLKINFATVPVMVFNGNEVYAGGSGTKNKVYVLRSQDRGETWTRIDKDLVGYYITSIAINNDKVFVGTNRYSDYMQTGVFLLNDDKNAFKRVTTGDISSMAASKGNVYAAGGSSVMVSTDNGSTWKSAGETFNGNRFEDERKKIMSAVIAAENTVYAAAGYSLYVLTDTATSWARYESTKKYEEAFVKREQDIEDAAKLKKRAKYKAFEDEEYASIIEAYNIYIAKFQGQSKEEMEAAKLNRDGKTVEAITVLKNVAVPTGKLMNQLAALEYNKKNYSEAYDMAGNALKLESNNPGFMVSRGFAALALGKPGETISLMDRLLIKTPGLATAHLLRGMALRAENQPQQAIGAYSKALQADAQLKAAFRERAAVFMKLSRYEDALKDYSQYISLDSLSTTTFNMRGMANARLGKFNESLADYTRSIQLAPNNYYALNNLGMLYLANKQFQLAAENFNQSNLFIDDYADNYFGLARVYDNRKVYREAYNMIKKAMALDSLKQPYIATYIQILITGGFENQAIIEADKLLGMNEKNTDGWLLKAMAQNNIKDFTGGINTMNAAIEKVPGNYLLYSMRAYIYRQQGNTAAADADDAKAKELSSK